MSNTTQQTEFTRFKRSYERGTYDRETLYGILDAMPLCHVGYVVEGRPVVTPTLQWREGDYVYWHGSSASRAIRTGAISDVCLTVSLIDGMVMARSAFHHSANYRAAMIFGKPEVVENAEEKTQNMKAMMEGFFPGRWDSLRPMTTQELKATTILRLKIDEATAKVRSGDPADDDEDYALPIWAGVLPITMQVGEAISDPRNLEGVDVPAHTRAFKIG